MILRFNSLLFAIICIVFLPSFVYVGLKQSSLTLGLLVSLLIFILFTIKLKINKIYINTIFIYLFLFHYILILILYFNEIKSKYFLSSFIIMIILFSSIFLYDKILNTNEYYFKSIIKKISYSIIIIGVISLIYKIDFLNYGSYSKNIFPYAEPSHFVISASFFMIFLGLVSNQYLRFLLVCIIFVLAILYKSLLLIVLSLMMSFIYYANNFKNLSYLIIIVLSIFSYILFFDDNNYFTDRLDFSSKNNNLTVLVYIQGIEEAYNNLIVTDGIGIGFQRLGETLPLDISERIYKLAGEYKNRTDGGFLASKLIGEFGMLGILIVIMYFIKFINSLFFIKKYLKYNLSVSSKIIFSHSVIIGFFIEMFARGSGYFTSGVVLLFTSILILNYYEKNQNIGINN